MNMTDNKNEVFLDIFEIIEDGVSWPKFFTNNMKIRMVEEVRTHFEDREDYGRVRILSDILLEFQE